MLSPNTKLYLHADLGREIATRWGRHIKGTVDVKIPQLDEAEVTKSLLCTIAAELITIREELQKPKPEPQSLGDPSDGMLKAFGKLAQKEPFDIWSTNLSGRARKAFLRAGFSHPSDITPEKLRQVRGCGINTINELIRFKNQYENQ